MSDPNKYKGSGVYWTRHLKVHGNDVSTLFSMKFNDYDNLVEFAQFFSEELDIVKSNKWANIIPENGYTGGNCRSGLKHSEETKLLLSELAKNRPLSFRLNHSKKMKGKTHTEETKEKRKGLFSGEKNGMFGKKHSEETKAKMRAARLLNKENKN